MKVALAFREPEHAHDGSAEGVAAHRAERLLVPQELVEVGGGDVRDVGLHLPGEASEVVPAVPDMDLAAAVGTAGLDEFLGHLGEGPPDQQVLPVGLIEPDRVGDRDFPDRLAGAGPFVHGCGKTDSVLPCHLLAMAQQVDVAPGRLVGRAPTVGEPDAGLLRDHPGFFHRGEAAGLAPAGLLPCHGELGIAVLPVHRVDLHSRGTVADLHDTAAALAFPGHQTRLSRQLVGKNVRKTCRGLV